MACAVSSGLFPVSECNLGTGDHDFAVLAQLYRLVVLVHHLGVRIRYRYAEQQRPPTPDLPALHANSAPRLPGCSSRSARSRCECSDRTSPGTLPTPRAGSARHLNTPTGELKDSFETAALSVHAMNTVIAPMIAVARCSEIDSAATIGMEVGRSESWARRLGVEPRRARSTQ